MGLNVFAVDIRGKLISRENWAPPLAPGAKVDPAASVKKSAERKV
jgi:hypothetical protein